MHDSIEHAIDRSDRFTDTDTDIDAHCTDGRAGTLQMACRKVDETCCIV